MIQVVRTCAHCGIDSEEVLLWLMLLIKGNWMQRRNAGIHLHVAGWEILYTNMGAPWMRERAATREYQVTKTQFEGRGAHLAFAGCRQGCRHWNKALEVNMQKQVGSWEYLNCYGSIWHRATLPTMWFLFQGTFEPDCPVYCYFTVLISIGITFILQASFFFPLQLLFFQCCPPFQALLESSNHCKYSVNTDVMTHVLFHFFSSNLLHQAG